MTFHLVLLVIVEMKVAVGNGDGVDFDESEDATRSCSIFLLKYDPIMR